MKNAQHPSNREYHDGANSGNVDGYLHSTPFVLSRSELFTGLASAFGIGLSIGGFIAAILFHL